MIHWIKAHETDDYVIVCAVLVGCTASVIRPMTDDEIAEFIKLKPLERWAWLAKNKPINLCTMVLGVALAFYCLWEAISP